MLLILAIILLTVCVFIIVYLFAGTRKTGKITTPNVPVIPPLSSPWTKESTTWPLDPVNPADPCNLWTFYSTNAQIPIPSFSHIPSCITDKTCRKELNDPGCYWPNQIYALHGSHTCNKLGEFPGTNCLLVNGTPAPIGTSETLYASCGKNSPAACKGTLAFLILNWNIGLVSQTSTLVLNPLQNLSCLTFSPTVNTVNLTDPKDLKIVSTSDSSTLSGFYATDFIQTATSDDQFTLQTGDQFLSISEGKLVLSSNEQEWVFRDGNLGTTTDSRVVTCYSPPDPCLMELPNINLDQKFRAQITPQKTLSLSPCSIGQVGQLWIVQTYTFDGFKLNVDPKGDLFSIQEQSTGLFLTPIGFSWDSRDTWISANVPSTGKTPIELEIASTNSLGVWWTLYNGQAANTFTCAPQLPSPPSPTPLCGGSIQIVFVPDFAKIPSDIFADQYIEYLSKSWSINFPQSFMDIDPNFSQNNTDPYFTFTPNLAANYPNNAVTIRQFEVARNVNGIPFPPPFNPPILNANILNYNDYSLNIKQASYF